MSNLKRHVGRIKNSDRRCVVVYMRIPGNEKNALIVDTDSLPDRYHDSLLEIVDSDVAQNTVNLAEVLDRRTSPDNNSINMLNALHQRGYFRIERIDNIVMYPRPNMPFPLEQVIAFQDKDKKEVAEPIREFDSSVKHNQYLENMDIENKEKRLSIAQGIIIEAELLEQEARRKREQAYNMAPSLRAVSYETREEYKAKTVEIDEEILERAQDHIKRAKIRQEQGLDTALEEPGVQYAISKEGRKKSETAPKKEPIRRPVKTLKAKA